MTGKQILNELQAYKQGMQESEVKKKYDLDRIVKLASNENPYGYSDKVKATLKAMTDDFELYPDGYATELRETLAHKLDVNNDQLVFGAGSDEIITMICRAFLAEGTNTVMAVPTFSQYRHHSLIEGAEVREIPVIDGHHDLTGMLQHIDKATRVVWLCTPDNPTGSIISQGSFDAFMEKCPKDVLVVLDAAYEEFVPESDRLHLHNNLSKYANLIILRTFSKAFGLAGFRAGYGISSEEIATKLNIVRGPFNVSVLSQRIAKAALDDMNFIAETRKKNEEVRTSFERFLENLGWGYYPSSTNFLLVVTPIDADIAAEFLLREGFIVRSGNVLGYPKTLRITIGTAEDMKELEKVIFKLDKCIDDGEIK